MHVCAESLSHSSVLGILQGQSTGVGCHVSQPRDQTQVSCIIYCLSHQRSPFKGYQFSSVPQSCLTLCRPHGHAACQASLTITNSRSLLKLMSISR